MELTGQKERIEKFLQDNKRSLSYMESLFSIDDNRDKEEEFYKEGKLKVLCLYLTPASSRAVSNTHNALVSLSKQLDPDNIVVDSCYFPEEENLEIFKSAQIPYIFGSTCHEPIGFYDVVLMSNAVCPEVLNIPRFYKYSGVGLTIEEREKQDTPLIFYGGAAANETSIVLGPIYRDGECIGRSLIDVGEYGYGEKTLATVAKTLLDYKLKGMNLHDKKAVKEELINNKVLIDYLYYPEHYEWIYDESDKFTIKEIKCTDERLPKQVKYGRIRLHEDMGWTIKTFNLSGDNADSHDIQISSGCSGGSSNCSFSFSEGTLLNSNRGLIQIENLLALGTPTGSPADSVVRYKLEGVKVQAQSGVEGAPLVYSVGTKPCKIIKTKRGYKLSVTYDHKCIVNRDGEDITVTTEEIVPGDRVYLSRSEVFGSTDRTLAECEFVGRMVGDGCYNVRMSIFGNKEEEQDIEDLLKEAGIEWTSKRDKDRNTVEYYIPEKYREVYGFRKHSQAGKGVPSEVMCYSEEQILAFLKGLLDSDATVSKNGKDITYATSSKEIHDTVKQLMLSVGILTTTREGDNVRLDEELGFDSTTHLYRLYVWGDESKKIVRSMKLRNKDKRERIDNAFYSDKDMRSVMELSNANPYMQKEAYLPTDEVESVTDDGIRRIYDITVEPTHTVVANGMVMNQCMEATVAGGYREKKLEDVEELMKHTVRDCAPNTISYFSYNLNYYYRFMDLLATGAKYFSGVTLLNERLDVVAKSPDQLKLAKKLGLKRFSGAIEGMGPRIRDGLLNKNLNHETLMQANEVISSLGLMHFKAGLIATGQETDQDIDDFIKEIDEEIAIRDKYGANHSFQFNITPLVFYSQIALRHFPRITAENSFNQVRNMGRFIEACQQRGIRSKFNGKGCGTWLEQLILDFGPAGTDWMVGLVNDEDLGYVRFFGDKVKEAAVRQLAKRGYQPLFFTKARPKDWIFPNDHIASIPEPLAKMWWDRTVAWNNGDPHAFDSKLCLKTPANPEGGKCYGCKMCETPEEIKDMTHRELYDEHTYEQVAEMLSDSREQKAVRVVVKQNSKWFFYNRTALAHYLTSRFLQANENIAEVFYNVGKTTTTWLSNNGQKGWFGGTWCFDIGLRDRIDVEEFNKVIEQINSKLTSCQILRVIDDTKTMKVKRETNISYIGQTTSWSLSQIKDKLSMFAWDIKVPVKSMGGQLDTEVHHMPELKDKVLFVQKGNGVIIGMDLPASISPYMVMSSILGKGYEKMLADFSFDVIDQVVETDMVDDKGQHIGYSYFTGKYNSRASIETIRLMLYKLTH